MIKMTIQCIIDGPLSSAEMEVLGENESLGLSQVYKFQLLAQAAGHFGYQMVPAPRLWKARAEWNTEWKAYCCKRLLLGS